MKWWTTDRIVALGLVLAMLFALAFGGSVELQTTIAGGLLGYISKDSVKSHEEQKPSNKVSEVLGKTAETASSAQKVVDSVDALSKAFKK